MACFSFTLNAQKEGVRLVVKIKHRDKPYQAAVVKIDKDGSFFDQASLDASANFSYIFSYESVYLVHFTGPGMATKSLEVDLMNIPAHEKGTLHDWELGELSLFKAYEGMDVSLLDQPVGRIHYDDKHEDFTIDYEYGAKIEKQMEQLTKTVSAQQKSEDIAVKAADKNYDNYIEQGDQSFKSNRYDNAMTYYNKAQDLFPDRDEVKIKIRATDSIINFESTYKDLVLEGDQLFRDNRYVEARDRYVQANKMKPAESYPKSQLSIVAMKVQEQEQKANEFNNYMAVADEAYESGNFKVASANYNKALKINPEAELARNKLNMSDKQLALADQNKLAEQKRFDQLMEEANYQLELNNFEEANAKLMQAKAIYPDHEKVNKQQVKLNFARTEYNNEQALLADQASREKEYESYKTNGQKADREGNSKSAIYFYEKALAIHPEDNFIQSRIRDLKGGGAVAASNQPAAPKAKTAENQAAELDKMDKKSDGFTALLASKYPEGTTEVSYKEGNKDVTKRIIVSGNKGTEYMKVTHSWGGTFFFRNGVSITENVWQKETK